MVVNDWGTPKIFPCQCLVKLFQKYISHHPPECKSNAFYLTPLKKPKGNVWYAQIPIGHNTLDGTVSRICKAAGITGSKQITPWEWQQPLAYFNMAWMQLVMARTGHGSLEGICTYKRIGEDQKQTVSDILNAATNGEEPCRKKPCLEDAP